MSPRFACRRHGHLQRGQATTEFVVLMLAAAPLFLGVTLIGKYIDLMQATEAASRYVAFEAVARHSGSTWKSDAELAVEVRRRFFSSSDAPVKTDDAAGDFAAHRNPIWSDAAGRPLIASFENAVGVRTQIADMNAVSAAAFAGALKLPTSNLYTASVTAKPADVPNLPPFDTIGLTISRRTVLLADAWPARDSAGVRSRIDGAPAMHPIAALRGLIDTAGALPALVFDPALRVGDFDWDVVPCDRLIGGC